MAIDKGQTIDPTNRNAIIVSMYELNNSIAAMIREVTSVGIQNMFKIPLNPSGPET